MSKMKLSTIKDAIEDVKNGKIVIVVDDEDRENEGDFIAAADVITAETVNFMVTHGRGLMCVPLTDSRCQHLKLHRMVVDSTDPLGTAFTVSVDYKGKGMTTGISVLDRTKTIQALVGKDSTSRDFTRPGHIFPLIAKEGGVLRRTGHTEAAIDLSRLAGLSPSGVIVEILNEDGTMARLPQLFKIAEKFDLKIISIEDLVTYRMTHDSLIDKKLTFDFETRFGTFLAHVYQQTTNNDVHLALTKGQWNLGEPVLTRINSSYSNDNIFKMLVESPKDDLKLTFERIATEEKAIIIFLSPKLKPLTLLSQLYKLRENKQRPFFTASDSTAMDSKDFGVGAQILHDLRVSKVKLLSNSPYHKRVGLTGYGLEILSTEKF